MMLIFKATIEVVATGSSEPGQSRLQEQKLCLLTLISDLNVLVGGLLGVVRSAHRRPAAQLTPDTVDKLQK